MPVAAGIDTAANIPGAKLEVIAGMGHDFAPALQPRLAEMIAAHCRAAMPPAPALTPDQAAQRTPAPEAVPADAVKAAPVAGTSTPVPAPVPAPEPTPVATPAPPIAAQPGAVEPGPAEVAEAPPHAAGAPGQAAA